MQKKPRRLKRRFLVILNSRILSVQTELLCSCCFVFIVEWARVRICRLIAGPKIKQTNPSENAIALKKSKVKLYKVKR